MNGYNDSYLFSLIRSYKLPLCALSKLLTSSDCLPRPIRHGGQILIGCFISLTMPPLGEDLEGSLEFPQNDDLLEGVVHYI